MELDALVPLAKALGASDFGRWAAGPGYPLVNVVHLLGLVLLLGGIGLVDLRIIGFFRALPLADVSRALTPVGIAGLAILLVSGPALFAADGVGLLRSTTFGWKLAAISLALVNALGFRAMMRAGRVTTAARAMAGISLAAWLTVATLGRLIAYS